MPRRVDSGLHAIGCANRVRRGFRKPGDIQSRFPCRVRGVAQRRARHRASERSRLKRAPVGSSSSDGVRAPKRSAVASNFRHNSNAEKFCRALFSRIPRGRCGFQLRGLGARQRLARLATSAMRKRLLVGSDVRDSARLLAVSRFRRRLRFPAWRANRRTRRGRDCGGGSRRARGNSPAGAGRLRSDPVACEPVCDLFVLFGRSAGADVRRRVQAQLG